MIGSDKDYCLCGVRLLLTEPTQPIVSWAIENKFNWNSNTPCTYKYRFRKCRLENAIHFVWASIYQNRILLVTPTLELCNPVFFCNGLLTKTCIRKFLLWHLTIISLYEYCINDSLCIINKRWMFGSLLNCVCFVWKNQWVLKKQGHQGRASLHNLFTGLSNSNDISHKSPTFSHPLSFRFCFILIDVFHSSDGYLFQTDPYVEYIISVP